MQEKEIIVKNLKTNYKIFGAGKPMLILHGWPSNSDKWQKVTEILQQKYLVVVPDLPGFGKSQEPKSAWSLNDYVEWLNEFIAEIPELKGQFYLLGHSFGGAIAAKFSLKYNQKIEKLFLVSAACIRKRAAVKKALYYISKGIKIFSFLPFYQMLRKGFYKFIIRKSDYSGLTGVMRKTYLKIISEDLSHSLIFIKVPTVIIWGNKDDLTPLWQANFINKKIENSQLIIIPEADHYLNTKMPEQLAKILLP